MRYLAVDHGEKRTGLAICDKDETMACPLKVVTGQAELVRQIVKVVREENIEAVVVGLHGQGLASVQTAFPGVAAPVLCWLSQRCCDSRSWPLAVIHFTEISTR